MLDWQARLELTSVLFGFLDRQHPGGQTEEYPLGISLGAGLQDDPSKLVGYKEITGHIIFDVKLGEGFRRKARFVADGHKTETPAAITYSTVVSRDLARIMLTIAALNDLEILGADVQNAFITAPNKEKCWMRAGPEFGPDEGKVFIVTRALYGLKSASASFRAYMAEKLDSMGFKSSMTDPDVWLRPAIKHDGEYYEYVLVYVDNILAISANPREILEEIQKMVKFKNDKIETPSTYLGGQFEEKQLNGHKCWTITSVDYIKAAIINVKKLIANTRWKLPSRATTPMQSHFTPELDGSPELNARETQMYQELIGILRWATELGQVDILLEISLLSQYQASPREGHLEQILHIFGYLKKKPKLTLYMDPDMPNIDYTVFNTKSDEFKEHYQDTCKELPPDMPRPRGRPITTTAFVDASHAANKKTHKSHLGYIVFLNRAPILWYSKRQQTVETSTFSSELIALKVCVETIIHLRYKLRMFGVSVPDNHATHIFCDNESVVKNSSRIESVLNKKHNSLADHFCQWAVAANIVTVAWLPTDDNLADAMTKWLTQQRRDQLFGHWTY